jgi:hypothetical protein
MCKPARAGLTLAGVSRRPEGPKKEEGLTPSVASIEDVVAEIADGGSGSTGDDGRITPQKGAVKKNRSETNMNVP